MSTKVRVLAKIAVVLVNQQIDLVSKLPFSAAEGLKIVKVELYMIGELLMEEACAMRGLSATMDGVCLGRNSPMRRRIQ